MNHRFDRLNRLQTLHAADPEGMLELLLDFPAQCESAWQLGGQHRFRPGKFDRIHFLGMGGSAIGGDLIRSYFETKIPVPIFIHRSYELPAAVGRSSLVFAISYSGNTEETLTAYRSAREKRAHLVVVTSGGTLLQCARRDGIPSVQIPSGFPPRAALGYLFFVPFLLLCQSLGLRPDEREFQEAVRLLKQLRDREVGPLVPVRQNLSKRLAIELFDHIPAIYAGVSRMDAVALRWRGQIAENAKQLGWSHLFPEMNHNEIMGWYHPRRLFPSFRILLLRDREDFRQVRRRMEITRSLIRQEEGVKILEVWSRGHRLLSRLFSLIYLGDFVSFYLAVLNRVDPTPVRRIEELKRRLAKKGI